MNWKRTYSLDGLVLPTTLMSRKEVLSLQKTLRRVKRMGVPPNDRDRVILFLAEEIDQYRTKLQQLDEACAPILDRPTVFYLCDKTSCGRCHNPPCTHTKNLEHAKNFEEKYGAFWERERADE